jgi:capsular exopolysaccharide synthesis family protein
LLIGTCIAGLLSFQRSRVEDPTAVESDFVLPVLASLPDVRRSRAYRRGMTIPEYLLLNPFSQFADSLRLLRLHLRSVVAGKAQVIQVTSAIPGEGKSTVASSLAMSAATAGISTILLDLDLHQSTVGQMLGHAHGRGLIDVLSGGAEIDAVIQTHARLPIRIINAGSLASLHPGMIEGKPLRDLIARLHQECDLVVIDSPPVLALSDPLYISALVDSTILVVGWRSTPQVFVDNAVSALRSAHAPLAGIVLNRVDPSRIGGYNAQRYHSEMNVMRLAPPASPGVATKALR